MRIPSKGRIAVCAMMDLAINGTEKPATIADLAERQEVSISYLEQLFSDLRAADLVHGARGPGGGYRLSRQPGDISVAQIIDAIDDKALKSGNVNEEYMPDLIWSDFADMAYDFLNDMTLDRLVMSEPEAQRLEKTPTQERHAELLTF